MISEINNLEPAAKKRTWKMSAESIARRVAKQRGQKRSPEIRAKMALAQQLVVKKAMAEKGYRISPEQRAQISATLTGRKLSPETIAKKKAWIQANREKCTPSQAHLDKLSALYKGKPFSGISFKRDGVKHKPETIAKMRSAHARGKNHHNFTTGLYCYYDANGKRVGPRNLRNGPEHIQWRKDCLKRDKYTCQDCGSKENLSVHHIKSFRGHVELRCVVSNGITLCFDCHAKVDPHFRRYKTKNGGVLCQS